MNGEAMQPMTLARACAIAAKAHEQTPDDREWIEQNLLSHLRELSVVEPSRSASDAEVEAIVDDQLVRMDDVFKKLAGDAPRSVNRSEDALAEAKALWENSDATWPDMERLLRAGLEDRERLDWLDKQRDDIIEDYLAPDGETEQRLLGHGWYVRGQVYAVRAAIDASRGVRPTPSDEGTRE